MSAKKTDVSFDRIKKEILKQAGSLIVVANATFNSNYIVAYRFTSAELKADKDLRFQLFGRESTDHALKIDSECSKILSKYYIANTIDFVTTLTDFEYLAESYNTNYGYVAEMLLCKAGFKKASDKQDNQGIDLIRLSDNTRSQVKCSIVKPDNHGSAGLTNRRAK